MVCLQTRSQCLVAQDFSWLYKLCPFFLVGRRSALKQPIFLSKRKLHQVPFAELYDLGSYPAYLYPPTVSSSREMAELLQYLLKVHHSTMCHAPRWTLVFLHLTSATTRSQAMTTMYSQEADHTTMTLVTLPLLSAA